jgi:hypothetical protein
MKKIISYPIIAAFVFTIGCKPNLQPLSVSKGSADFSNYVAMGNSLCAGYTDGGVSKYGQENSYPRMLAQQFALAGGGEFRTPFLSPEGNGNNGSDQPLYQLVIPSTGGSPVPAQIGVATTINDNVAAQGPYNHLGVPGIRTIEADIAMYGGYNKFLGRISPVAGGSSLLSLAIAKKPTFFSYWLGSNDVLLWATAGGVGPVITTPFAITDLTSYLKTNGALIHPAMVAGNIAAQIDSLTKNGAKGVMANVPDVASTPYFTTIPYNAVVLNSQPQVDALNAMYKGFNDSVPTTNKIIWKLGANPLVIIDSNAPNYKRQATSQDLICLTALSSIKLGKGSAAGPLTDADVLDKDEVAIARTFTDQYNAAIQSIADAKGLAFVDANAYLKTFTSGIKFNGVDLNPTFVTGGGFGLDGVHPTPRGYALIANEFIKAINLKYGSTLPYLDILQYRSVLLP